MDRRSFLKTSLGGTAMYVPASLTLDSLLNKSYAAAPDYSAANVDPGTVSMPPQVIHIFLYGGPSELSGNLSIIDQIAAASQSDYAANINGILNTNPEDLVNGQANGQITKYGFWQNAGGGVMDFLVDNNYMTVYRTMTKRVNDTRSHRESIFQTQKGTTDVEQRPGIGTTLAHVLDSNQNAFQTIFGKSVNSLILPFVSLEGETTFFAPDPGGIINNFALRYQTLGTNLQNPFARTDANNFDSLVAQVNPDSSARFSRVKDALRGRQQLENQMNTISNSIVDGGNNLRPLDFTGVTRDAFDDTADFAGDVLNYPNTAFGNQLRAAVTLAIENQDSLFISAGNNGLGGWDDHNNACDPNRYAARMQELFDALRVACKHIKYSGTQTATVTNTPGGAALGVNKARRTDNIVINVYGEFGRRCNLNGSCGWDHGNTQNLFTLMGSGVRPGGAAALGKVVGSTQLTGTPNTNNQFQMPANTSYEFEPASVASTIYQAFGVTNPQVLTADEVMNPGGSPAIDQTVAAEPMFFTP